MGKITALHVSKQSCKGGSPRAHKPISTEGKLKAEHLGQGHAVKSLLKAHWDVSTLGSQSCALSSEPNPPIQQEVKCWCLRSRQSLPWHISSALVNQGSTSTSGTPRSQEMLNCSCSLVTACKGQRGTVLRAREPQGTAHQHPQGVPPKKQADLWGRALPQHILISIPQTSVSKPSAATPGARTCLAGLILLSLALVSVISSLGFSGISHYLPCCERSSNTEEVFSFPLEFCLGHCLAARQNYQSLLPKALLSGLEILRCWRSGDLRYIGRALYLQLALFWVLANAISLLPKRNSYYGIDFLPQKKQREWLLVKCNSRKISSLL